MKTISEYILEEKFKKYLLSDLKQLIECFNEDNLYFENRNGKFKNYENAVEVVFDSILKLSEKFKEEKFTISIKDCYCKTVTVLPKHTKLPYVVGGFESCDKLGNVEIEIKLPKNFKRYSEKIKGLILHELLHAYEEYNRMVDGQNSIFQEFTDEYKIAAQKANYKGDKTIKNLITLKYFLNYHERRAYFTELEECVIDIIEKIKPTMDDLKIDKIFDELCQKDLWKRYFDFGEFVVNIDNIDKSELEDTYTIVYELPEIKSARLKERIRLVKKYQSENKIPPKEERVIIKSASEIIRESKRTWKNFKREFDYLFVNLLKDLTNLPYNKKTLEKI